MIIVTTYHFLFQEDGFFAGAAEVLENQHLVNLWDEEGTIDFNILTFGLSGERLYPLLIDAFTAELGLDRSEVYLTDREEKEILFAF